MTAASDDFAAGLRAELDRFILQDGRLVPRIPHADLPRSFGSVVCCVDGTCHLPEARWHGSAGGYSNHDCRCAPCTEAWADFHYSNGYNLRLSARRIAQGLTTHGDPRKLPYRPHPVGGAAHRRPRRPAIPQEDQ